MKHIRLNYLPQLPRHKDAPIGCIGSGFIMADCHLVAYRQAGFNPVAIASRTPAHAPPRSPSGTASAGVRHLRGAAGRSGRVEVVDIAVPPDVQIDVIREVVKHKKHIRGVLAQKPLGINYAQAARSSSCAGEPEITLAVNQNMRYDQSIRACKSLLDRGDLGEPVLATIDMRAIPHWMPWQQRQGWVTLRIMSIHHLDTFRYLVRRSRSASSPACGPIRGPRRSSHTRRHLPVHSRIRQRPAGQLVGRRVDRAGPGRSRRRTSASAGASKGPTGLARGTIGWPEYPKPTPSTLDFTTTDSAGNWFSPRWNEVWFPDAFVGHDGAAARARWKTRTEPEISGRDNLKTMALVDACYLSAREHRAVELREVVKAKT